MGMTRRGKIRMRVGVLANVLAVIVIALAVGWQAAIIVTAACFWLLAIAVSVAAIAKGPRPPTPEDEEIARVRREWGA